jgi:hypothetical protein
MFRASNPTSTSFRTRSPAPPLAAGFTMTLTGSDEFN